MNSGYQALEEGAAWIDLSDRGKILVTGVDRKRLLHAMTTNHIEQLAPGEGCYAYFLSAQGRILADVNVLCRSDSLMLDTEPETREKIFEHLDRFIIADDVTLEDATDSIATIAVEGPRAADLVERLGLSSEVAAKFSLSGGGGYLIFVPVSERAHIIAELESAGAVAVDRQSFDVVRIEHGKPRYGQDLSERFLAQEANQSQALSFSKGCYLGQEIVERVRSRGQVHRMLMPIEIEGTAVPEAGTKFGDATGTIAEITSAALSPRLGKVVALAYVRADKAKPGAEIQAGETAIRVR
jgi:folate-binding protein YgfZ